MKIKTRLALALTVSAGTMLITSTPLHADTDSRIDKAARKSYVFKTYLKDDQIKVDAKDGIVTLTGMVSEESHRTLAENTVASLPGVIKVDDQLNITGAQPPEHSDAWISTKVKSTLLFHSHVNGFGTTVYVKDGVVTLQGVATSMAQKELTTEYAKDIDNVKEVQNNMTIATAPAAPDSTISAKIDDASITAQVKSALLSHHSTSALHTTVVTVDGVVTLEGVAKNEAEKALVTKLVTDINGVNSVVNNMTIAPPVAAN